jgi:hypothetical protein
LGQAFLWRPLVAPMIEEAMRDQLALGHGMLKVAELLGVGSRTVQWLRREIG